MNQDLTEIKDLFKEYEIIEEEEIKEVKPFGTGGHITISGGLVGKRIVIGVLKKWTY